VIKKKKYISFYFLSFNNGNLKIIKNPYFLTLKSLISFFLNGVGIHVVDTLGSSTPKRFAHAA
jgi:hypothetical protein